MTDNPRTGSVPEMPDQSIDRRVVIVTGSGQGIGRSYAHYLARAGATPVIAERALKSGYGNASTNGC